MPPTIVAAFRATLEELEEADLLLHVVDITHKDAQEQFQTVEDILNELKLTIKKRFIVANKVDVIVQDEKELDKISLPDKLMSNQTILISAMKSWGIGTLMQKIDDFLANIDNKLLRETRTVFSATATSNN